ncbi:MauE/DoxX family redox-associated membrane protein [Pedococcus sp. 5OH_020]|uniref:MauE/DoxX family redox-associated membrane protein n=1 Tax=Pedococcus sp. 5OH_020 TaxID=2989814 RepID=UPI0022E998BD|nr:MauE/DoxX family redox-associated membrane protein [Pedococcus sp. 5OH_020]
MVDGVVAGISVATSAVLFLAGPGKLTAPTALASALTTTVPYLRPGQARTAARLVGVVESCVAVLLATGSRPHLTGTALAALGLAVLVLSVVAGARGLTVPCGCFSAVDATDHRTLGPRTAAYGAGFVAVGALHGLATSTGPADLRLTAALTLALACLLATHAAQLRPLLLQGLGRGQ